MGVYDIHGSKTEVISGEKEYYIVVVFDTGPDAWPIEIAIPYATALTTHNIYIRFTKTSKRKWSNWLKIATATE